MVQEIIYKRLIKECRRYMKGMKPSSWQWQSNARSIIRYIAKIREIKNDKES